MEQVVASYQSDDKSLLKQIISRQAGWQAAFTQLFHKYKADIHRRSVNILGNNSDAEDVVQEVFIRVYRYIHQFKGQSSLKTWLMRMTENQCYSFLNVEKKHQKKMQQLVESLSGPESSYEIDTQEAEKSILVSTALNNVILEVKEVLSLRYWLELSIQEIAHVLGIGLSACKMRLQRAHRVYLQEINYILNPVIAGTTKG